MEEPTSSGGLRNRLTCLNLHVHDDSNDDDDDDEVCKVYEKIHSTTICGLFSFTLL
jgi:hypothetical protein